MTNKMLAKDNGETISQHTDKLLEHFDKLLSMYGRNFSAIQIDGIKYISKMHDIGKINSRFQNKIMAVQGSNEKIGTELDDLYNEYNIQEIPHGFISICGLNVVELENKYGKELTQILISSIAWHHKRSLENKNGENIPISYIFEIAKKELELFQNSLKSDITINKKALRYCYFMQNNIDNVSDKTWREFAFYKGMLNKLDYCASSGAESIEINGDNAASNIENVFIKKNYQLNDCQKFFKENQNNNIIAVASTGIGKTESALLWQGDSKCFYTLPIKVAINAIYERIVKENYYSKEKTCYLHSDTFSYLVENYEENAKKQYEQIKSLAYPLTICTIDQLFTFVSKAMGTEIFLSTLSYSKIVIDEIQSYSPKLLAFIIYGLKTIAQLGGKFCIMTATLPPFIPHLLKKYNINFVESQPFYKISEKTSLPIERHCIRLIDGDFDYEKITEFAKTNKVLVVCNTVFRAQEVFKTLKNSDVNINLLHSRFTLEDKKKKENEILDFAPNNEKNEANGIWVSTQIVEASLDIDFDYLFTDMCTADSLLQRLGRCYRSRDFDLNEPNCYIFNTKYGYGSIYDKEIYDRSWNFLLEFNDKVFSENDKINYINKVFHEKEILQTNYYKKIKNWLSFLDNLLPNKIEKKEAQEKFRDIETVSILTYKDYKDFSNQGIFERLENSQNNIEKLKLKNLIREKSINVSVTTIKYSKQANITINPILNQKFFYTNNIYDYELGMQNNVDDENFI